MSGLSKHALAMLERFDAADDWGIERQFVPPRILTELQEAGYVTLLDATPRITESGRNAIRKAKP